MRARHCLAVVAVLGASASAGADPKPEPVDIKAYRDKLILLRDAAGGTYAAFTERDTDAHLFYGTGTTLYEQILGGRTFNEDAWTLDAWAPRVTNFRNGAVVYKPDHTFARVCGDEITGLTQLTGDKAKQFLAKATFMSPPLARRAHLLARDDSGVYYYVDALREKLGGKGFRVFVGKKGGMKEMPITDIASDTEGQVFSTKSGDLRLVTSHDEQKSTAVWIKGEKRTPLVFLDVDMNAPVIYRDLGIYPFIGTLCENQ